MIQDWNKFKAYFSEASCAMEVFLNMRSSCLSRPSKNATNQWNFDTNGHNTNFYSSF